MNAIAIWQDSFAGGMTCQKASAYTGQHKHKETPTYLHVANRIRTHDPTVRAVEDCELSISDTKWVPSMLCVCIVMFHTVPGMSTFQQHAMWARLMLADCGRLW
jgi:hypothetical protein